MKHGGHETWLLGASFSLERVAHGHVSMRTVDRGLSWSSENAGNRVESAEPQDEIVFLTATRDISVISLVTSSS